jgi:hypothetical protein
MSVQPLPTPAPRRIGVRAISTSWAQADAVAVLLLTLGFVAALAVTWNAWGDLRHDTGYDLLAAQRMHDGQLPYLDFPYIYGPLGIGILGAAFKVFGATVGVAVAVGIALGFSAIMLTYALARQVTTPLASAVAAGLAATTAVATGNISLITPHAMAASVAVVVSLAGLLTAARFAASGRRLWLVGSGVATGLLALTRPEFLAALALATLLWLGLRIVTAPERGRAVRDALAWAAAAVVVPVVAYGAILTQVSPRKLIDNLYPSDQLAAGSNAVLKAAAPLTAHSFASLAADLLAYGVIAAAIVGVGMLAARRPRLVLIGAAGALLLLLAVLAARPEAVRSRLHYAFEWIPAGAAIALVILARLGLRSRAEWRARDQVALLTAGFLAVLAAKTYAAFDPQPNPDFSQFATYALPFAAVFLAWLHVETLPRGSAAGRTVGLAWVAALLIACAVLVAGDGRDETFVVHGSGGSIAAGPQDGQAYQQALDAIVARTQPGEPVLIAPQGTALYTLSGRTDPLPELSLLPGTLPTEQAEADAIARMGSVRLAVTDRRKLSEYGQGAFGESYNRRLGAWLRSDFKRVATYRGAESSGVILDLWQRSAQK